MKNTSTQPDQRVTGMTELEEAREAARIASVTARQPAPTPETDALSSRTGAWTADHVLELISLSERLERDYNEARIERDEAVKELAALKASTQPLPRPDKPGWWWLWTNEGTPPRWLPVYVSMPEASKDGQWLPATPPPEINKK